MTTLSKDEILRLAGSANAYQDEGVFYLEEKELVAFAHLCRADLVEEIRTLKADAENFSPTIGLVDKLQLERDALRAENERLAVKLSHTQLDCQTEAATVVALRAENERLASLAKEYRDNGDRLLDVTNSLRAELSALRAGSGEAVAWVYELPNDRIFTYARWDEAGRADWKETPLFATPQPSAGPVVRELVEALEAVGALIEHQYTGTRDGMNALQNAADDAHDALKTGQQWLKENT